MRLEHLDPYSIRKGSATYASSSGKTVPPPIQSIFHRGEWSLGVILDRLDPCSEKFGIFPPHFNHVPSDNQFVQEGLNICFGNILKVEYDENNNGNSFMKGILLRCLVASLVCQANDLQWLIAKKGDTHPFHNIPLMQHPEFLEQLKLLVTTEPTLNIMSKATGVLPHTQTIKELLTVIDALLELKHNWENGFESLLESTASS